MQVKDQKVSRRLFLTVGSAAVASPYFLSGSSTYASALIPKVSNTNLIVFTDPATVLAVVGAGLEVAKKLKELFGKNSTGGNTRLLAEIHSQNAQIITMLGQVLVILDNLGVTIRAGVRDELLNHIKVTLSVNFQRFYETWQAELASPAARRQAPARYKEIQDISANLGRHFASHEAYGYAHFQTVGHAMLVEMWISHRLKEAKEFRRQAAKTYATYFEAVLNPDEIGSISAQLVAAQAQVARMDKILADADEFISKKPTWILPRRKISGDRMNWVTAEIERTITGNRTSGYLPKDRYINRRSEHERPAGGGPGGGGGIGKKKDDLASLEPDPVDTGDKSALGRIKYWNSVRTVYLKAVGEVQALEKSKETANIYKNIAQEIISNP